MSSIKEMQIALRKCITDWKHDGCVPPNHVREDGMGTEISRVDVWCGGFQDSHNPVTVGWKVQRGNQVMNGVLLMAAFDDEDAAITEAKRLADEAMKKLDRGASHDN
jgi:hypothetical protein